MHKLLRRTNNQRSISLRSYSTARNSSSTGFSVNAVVYNSSGAPKYVSSYITNSTSTRFKVFN